MPEPHTCWVVSDGRRGIENQALGLAEAMSVKAELDISSHHISRSGLLAMLPGPLQNLLGRKYKFPSSTPDLAIGCGRQAIAPLMDLKSKGAFTVYVQDPRLDPVNFDVVIAPEHDQLSGENVLSIIGSPNRITPEKLETDKGLIKVKDGKVAAFLIGGKSKNHDYDDAHIHQHSELFVSLLEDDWQIFLTASRRTTNKAMQYFSHFDNDFENFNFYDGRGPNPYFAYLYHAHMIFVTEDSTNMLTEACATGKPVFRLPMAGQPGKFQTLYDALEKRCRVRLAINSDLSPQSYAPLQETKRAAAFVWDKFQNSV